MGLLPLRRPAGLRWTIRCSSEFRFCCDIRVCSDCTAVSAGGTPLALRKKKRNRQQRNERRLVMVIRRGLITRYNMIPSTSREAEEYNNNTPGPFGGRGAGGREETPSRIIESVVLNLDRIHVEKILIIIFIFSTPLPPSPECFPASSLDRGRKTTPART